MTDEQKAAFILGQVALMNCRLAGMQAENAKRAVSGASPAYDEAAFARLDMEFVGVLGYNAMISFFRS